MQFGQKIAPQILKILFIDLYLQFFDKTFILTVPYQKEVASALIQALEGSEILRLGERILGICYDRK